MNLVQILVEFKDEVYRVQLEYVKHVVVVVVGVVSVAEVAEDVAQDVVAHVGEPMDKHTDVVQVEDTEEVVAEEEAVAEDIGHRIVHHDPVHPVGQL